MYIKLFEELFIRNKYSDKEKILYLGGSAPELNRKGKLIVRRGKQSLYSILSTFGDDVLAPKIYWHGGNYLFDEISDIIETENIKALVGNSAGGLLSFYLSNRYKIPAMSINPAIAPTSEAPTLQIIPDDVIMSKLNPNQLIVIGEEDRKSNWKKGGQVDTHLVLSMLKELKFEEKGGTIIIYPDTYHSISNWQFRESFKIFYEKYLA